ncbi:MAG: sigma-70 family RNA polymerase sigma factor [Eubacteriales bacterium]|nr:sigma-70 family RNA polymerase sigma factor [Eubacteriales bacterium]
MKILFLKRKAEEKERRLLEELYELYEQKMYAAAFSILHHSEQAEDAVHDAFVKLIKYLPEIDSAQEDTAKMLVMRILRTTAIDQYRRNHRESEHIVSQEYLEDKNAAVFPIQAAEDREYLSGLLCGLQESFFEVIRLRCFYGFTAKETGEILGVSEDVVNKRLERARKQIREIKGAEIDEKKGYRSDFREFRRVHSGRTM